MSCDISKQRHRQGKMANKRKKIKKLKDNSKSKKIYWLPKCGQTNRCRRDLTEKNCVCAWGFQLERRKKGENSVRMSNGRTVGRKSNVFWITVSVPICHFDLHTVVLILISTFLSLQFSLQVSGDTVRAREGQKSAPKVVSTSKKAPITEASPSKADKSNSN